MPNPTITPNAPGNSSYVVTGSRQAWLDLTIDVDNLGETGEFTLTCPEIASVTLFKGAATLALSTNSPVNDGATFAGYNVTAFGSAAAGNASIIVTIEPNAPPVNEIWRVRLSTTSPVNYSVFEGVNATIERVIADPSMTISPLTTVFERDTIALNGSAAYTRVTSAAAGLAPLPLVRARWSQVAGLVAAAPPPTLFSGPLTAVANVNFTSPSLYRSSESVTYRLTGFYDENNNSAGDADEPFNTAEVGLTIEPRQRHMLLAVDRSGSMLATMPGTVPPISRWEFARRAAHVWADLWIALRGSVNPEDKAGILVFESNACGWGSASTPIEIRLPPTNALGGIGDLDVATLDLQDPGSCTPIGDALITSIDTFVAANGTTDATYTLLLMTDGYENSGFTVVEDDSPVPVGATGRFAQERIKPSRLVVSDRLTMYSCGLGTPGTVQESVLNDLPNLPNPVSPTDRGIYSLVQANELLSTFTEMLTHALDAQMVAPMGAPANNLGDPNAIYVPMVGDHRAVFVVQWNSSLDQLSVFFRPQGTASWTQVSGVGIGTPPTGVTYFRRSHHGLVDVDLRALLGNPPADTEWAILHQPGGGASQPIPADRFVALADLVVKADISFDRPFYRTNHRMRITCNLTAAGEPIHDARVMVELARPGESLGTFLAQNSQDYRPDDDGGKDPLAPKAAMLQTLIRRTDQKDGQLPVIKPPIIFFDGTNELWDDGGHRDGAERDGVFANTYTRLDQEGTYAWRFFIEGRTPSGGYFTRLLTRSVWVGIGVDPRATKVELNFDVSGRGGLSAVQIIVLPADRRGQLLGPFRASDVQISATGGQFLGSGGEQPFADDGVVYPQPDHGDLISHYDGRYSRILLFTPGEKIEVRITIQGLKLDPIVI